MIAFLKLNNEQTPGEETPHSQSHRSALPVMVPPASSVAETAREVHNPVP
jgi:hypothetical protein